MNELDTTFVVLQTIWDFWIICCLSFIFSVIFANLVKFADVKKDKKV